MRDDSKAQVTDEKVVAPLLYWIGHLKLGVPGMEICRHHLDVRNVEAVHNSRRIEMGEGCLLCIEHMPSSDHLTGLQKSRRNNHGDLAVL